MGWVMWWFCKKAKLASTIFCCVWIWKRFIFLSLSSFKQPYRMNECEYARENVCVNVPIFRSYKNDNNWKSLNLIELFSLLNCYVAIKLLITNFLFYPFFLGECTSNPIRAFWMRGCWPNADNVCLSMRMWVKTKINIVKKLLLMLLLIGCCTINATNVPLLFHYSDSLLSNIIIIITIAVTIAIAIVITIIIIHV